MMRRYSLACSKASTLASLHVSACSTGTQMVLCALQRSRLMQLLDELGNAVEALDVAVTISLAWPEQQGATAAGRELPRLEMAERQTQQSDAQGRVFFGDVYIAEGRGRVEHGAADPTMELDLIFAAASSSGYGSLLSLIWHEDTGDRASILSFLK